MRGRVPTEWLARICSWFVSYSACNSLFVSPSTFHGVLFSVNGNGWSWVDCSSPPPDCKDKLNWESLHLTACICLNWYELNPCPHSHLKSALPQRAVCRSNWLCVWNTLLQVLQTLTSIWHLCLFNQLSNRAVFPHRSHLCTFCKYKEE